MMDIPFPQKTKNGAIVLFSGGVDSTTLLRYALIKYTTVLAVSVHYGQRHAHELAIAHNVFADLRASLPPEVQERMSHRVIELPGLRDALHGSSQTSDSVQVPHGHYTANNMKKTVVPNRNMVLISVAAGLAIAEGNARNVRPYAVCYACHTGDHAVYADCRPEFVDGMGRALLCCNEDPVYLDTPFLRHTKAEIVRLGGFILGVDLCRTWSCYEGLEEEHCGLCGTCIERREAFALAEIVDVTTYGNYPDLRGEQWLEFMQDLQQDPSVLYHDGKHGNDEED